MQVVTQTNQVRGRRDRAGQENAIELEPIRERIEGLVALYGASCTAADEFNETVKAAAENAGLLAAVVRKFVIARAGERFAEESRKVEQLSLLFTEVGE
jgi:hypothetical protein